MVKETLRSCVKVMNFFLKESRGELQEFSKNKLKDLQVELIAKLKTATKEVADGDDEYPLLVNLKRLYELQLSIFVPIDNLYEEFASVLQNFRSRNDETNSFLLLNMFLHIKWSLYYILSSETVSESSVSSLLSERNTLFKHLESFLPTSHTEVETDLGHQLACIVCTILAELWCLFKKPKFSSTALEVLGFCPEQSVLERFWKLCEQQIGVSSPNGEEYAWYQCTVNGGREGRPIGAYELAKAVEELGAGEILLNCIDCDGQGKGFDIDLVKQISDAVTIPVIASSGAGAPEHFSEVFNKSIASAALAAGMFHRKEVRENSGILLLLLTSYFPRIVGFLQPASQPYEEC